MTTITHLLLAGQGVVNYRRQEEERVEVGPAEDAAQVFQEHPRGRVGEVRGAVREVPFDRVARDDVGDWVNGEVHESRRKLRLQRRVNRLMKVRMGEGVAM